MKMDTTSQFFIKLRRLAVTLETETTKLQEAFENRNSDGDSESAARGTRAYHELNRDVLNIKEQIQVQVAQQKANVDEVSSFIKDCEVQQQKLSEDINMLRGHWEKYGYQPLENTEATSNVSDHLPKEEARNEHEMQSPDKVEGHHEESGEGLSPEKPAAAPDYCLRTPQLSDFGLSGVQLKRTLAGGEWCSALPPMPVMSLPHPSLNTPAPPSMANTPKRALRMDDYEWLTPQMIDFGISERTMCLNNDFTMALQLKNVERPIKLQQNLLEPPVNPMMENLQANVDLESPEPPVFCTPELNTKKSYSSTEIADIESPSCPPTVPSTPMVPAFQTPYVNRLVSTHKNERNPEPIKMGIDDDSHVSHIPTMHSDGAVASKRRREYDVPALSIEEMMTNDIPEMPNLESNLGKTMQARSTKMQKKFSDNEKPVVSSLDLDGPTQEFNLGTRSARRDYEELSTPEMPDLSSETLDICKLVSQAQLKTSVKHSHEKENTRIDALSLVSEREFLSLPDYLRQVMTLNSLNQAVHNINSTMAKCKGDKTEVDTEELTKMINFGKRTQLFILCLTELKRLDHIKATTNTSVYKLKTHS